MLCATVLVARMLGTATYGELGMIRSTVGMFGVFAGFGLGLTSTKHVAELRTADPDRAGRIMALSWTVAAVTGGLMGFGLLVFAPWLAGHTINAPHLSGALRVGSLILLINALNGAQTGALSGFEAFKAIACVNLITGLISFPVLVCGAYFGGLIGSVWALVVSLGVNWLLNHIAIRCEARRHQVPMSFRGCWQDLSILWTFSLPAALSSILVAPAGWGCRVFLANRPGGYEELGVFAVALIFQVPLVFIGNMIGRPLLSIVSNAGPKLSHRLGVVNVLTTWLLGVIVAIPLLCFPGIVTAMLGDQYGTTGFRVTFSIVIFYTSIINYTGGLNRILAARNLLWWGFLSNALRGCILIVSAALLVGWGAPGLAASFALAHVLNGLVFLPFYYTRDLVPRGTLLSMNAALIWLMLVSLAVLNIIGIPLLLRCVLCVGTIVFVLIAFQRLFNKSS